MKRRTRQVEETSLVEAPVTKEEQENKKKQNEPGKLGKGEMEAEVKILERRYDPKGNQYIAQLKPMKVVTEKIDWWQKFALCVTHQLDRSNRKIVSSSLQINSQILKDLLKQVIGDFPGVSFVTKNISLNLPARPLFHYRQELEEAGKKPKDIEATADIALLLKFIDEQFEQTAAESQNLIEQGLISYDILWTIFRPGTIVYARVLGQPRAFTLLSYQYVCGQSPALQLSVSYVDYDGEQFGTREMTLSIPAFFGTEHIADFGVYPINFSCAEKELRSSLISRGRTFESLVGQNFRCYKGIAVELACPLVRYSIDGRVMVDCETFHRLTPNSAFGVTAFPGTDSSAPRGKRRKHGHNQDQVSSELVPTAISDLPPLTDKQCLLTNATVRGFSFSEKKFLDFFVDQLRPVDWNLDCFDQLVLPVSQKDIVRALVANHASSGAGGFDDIVKGKGKGLIFVLHGPPGVGKTLTAECVAEFSERPLYIVSSGDLGTNSEALDSRLSRIMDMASTWKAVLLIDEADVFLEERSSHDVERNSLVSIFLRVLEYYEGVLFLTSNRVATFDDAFKSRIHVPLKYVNLPRESRKKIWVNLLGKVEGGVKIHDAGYEKLSECELNGRQVKNVVRTAGSLAKFNGKELDLEQLLQVVTIQMQFEQDLTAGQDNGRLGTPLSPGK